MACESTKCDLAPERKIEMLTLDGCPHCHDAISYLKSKGLDKRMTILNEVDDRELALADKLKIDAFPTIVVDDEKKCDLAFENNEYLSKVKCEDGTEFDL